MPFMNHSAPQLNVARGQLFGLLGPNGAGKTTTIGMLHGEVLPCALARP